MDGKAVLIGILVLTNIVAGVAYINASASVAEESERIVMVEDALGTTPVIDADRAINITTANETIKAYMDEKFKAPNRRNVHVALVQNSTYNLTGSLVGVNESPFLWKVDIIERSCSCSGRGKSLYIATALVNPMTGEIVDAATYAMSETAYGRNTCENACHK